MKERAREQERWRSREIEKKIKRKKKHTQNFSFGDKYGSVIPVHSLAEHAGSNKNGWSISLNCLENYGKNDSTVRWYKFQRIGRCYGVKLFTQRRKKKNNEDTPTHTDWMNCTVDQTSQYRYWEKIYSQINYNKIADKNGNISFKKKCAEA